MVKKKDNKALWIFGAILLFVFIQSGKKSAWYNTGFFAPTHGMFINPTVLLIPLGIIIFLFMMFKN